MEISLVSRIFRAGSEIKNRALLYKGFRKPKSGARINKLDSGKFSRRVSGEKKIGHPIQKSAVMSETG